MQFLPTFCRNKILWKCEFEGLFSNALKYQLHIKMSYSSEILLEAFSIFLCAIKLCPFYCYVKTKFVIIFTITNHTQSSPIFSFFVLSCCCCCHWCCCCAVAVFSQYYLVKLEPEYDVFINKKNEQTLWHLRYPVATLNFLV